MSMGFLEKKYGDDYESMLRDFIPYLEQTAEEEWCVDVVRTEDGKANCLFGHLSNFCCHSKNDDVMPDFDWFESRISTTFMVYAVNDGENHDYQQPTPKQRGIAYMRDLLSGKKLTTLPLMDKCLEEYPVQLAEETSND
uniref:hypothetical protein n=1 Tax=Salmonella enterica TaxID=28901 RepID=UPI003A9509E9